ncbi:MAG: chemotaxis protein CheX [Planctomycetes bacterium]|nr:chemotaxis protein CheX [Planctomycetota bacterium]
MDTKYIEPFRTAIEKLFDTMLLVNYRLDQSFLQMEENKAPRYDVSSIIGLSGSVTGCMALNMSEAQALYLASSLSGEDFEEMDEDCKDAIGEIANIICGSAKRSFPGEDNSISIPSVIIGNHEVTYPKGLPIVSIPFDTDVGRVTIDLALKESPVPTSAR